MNDKTITIDRAMYGSDQSASVLEARLIYLNNKER